MQHEALSSLIASDFLFDQIGLNHRAASNQFILGCVLEQHFTSAMRKQKHIVARKVMPKFFNWPMPLKDIQYPVRKVDIIPLPILSLKKSKISEKINILCCLVERLSLKGVVEDKVVSIKDDYLTIKNVTRALYQKQGKPNQLMRFS